MIPFRQKPDGRLADSVTNRILEIASRLHGARYAEMPERESAAPSPFGPILPAGFTELFPQPRMAPEAEKAQQPPAPMPGAESEAPQAPALAQNRIAEQTPGMLGDLLKQGAM